MSLKYQCPISHLGFDRKLIRMIIERKNVSESHGNSTIPNCEKASGIEREYSLIDQLRSFEDRRAEFEKKKYINKYNVQRFQFNIETSFTCMSKTSLVAFVNKTRPC